MTDEAKRSLGQALRKARIAAELTQANVADTLGRSQGHIHKIETGKAVISQADLDQLIDRLTIPDDQAVGLRALANEIARGRDKAAQPPNWSAFWELLEQERHATKILSLHGERIPGPLQCESYIIQVMTEVYGDVDITNVIRLRKERAKILTKPDGPAYHVILSEAAVRRTLRGRDHIRADQVSQLLTMINSCQRLKLQILPLESRVLFVDSDFELLRFEDRKLDFVYVECPGGAYRFKDKSDLKDVETHWGRLSSAALDLTESRVFLEKLPN